MSPWNRIENSFFWMTYNTLAKNFTLGWYWQGRIYRFTFHFKFDRLNLVDDSRDYSNEHERYKKEQYAGHLQTKSNQRPHHTGIHYDKSDKQLASLSPSERQAELDRRKLIAEANRIRPYVG